MKTEIGGWSAPGGAMEGVFTHIHLARAKEKLGDGRYWTAQKVGEPHIAAYSVEKQEEMLENL